MSKTLSLSADLGCSEVTLTRMKVRIDFPQCLNPLNEPDQARLERTFRHPIALLTAWQPAEVTSVIAQAEAASQTGHWALGFVAYEAAAAFTPHLVTHSAKPGLPLAMFAVYRTADESDNTANGAADFLCSPWSSETHPTIFTSAMAQIQTDINAGRYYQTNYTTRLRAQFSGDADSLFAALRAAQPGGFAMHIASPDWQILSVSPELFFDWQPPQAHGSGELLTRPMKGTAPRQTDPVADQASADTLRSSVKEQAENLMIVDLLRNDMSQIAETGSVKVNQLFALEALPSVWQMTSTITCQTPANTQLVDIFKALFPCGSVTGAPKITAMQAIKENESSPRGVYCGALGIIRPGGHATFSVAIRTVVIDQTTPATDNTFPAECGIGSAITSDARAADEFDEWQAKSRFLMRASAPFQLIETLRLTVSHTGHDYWLLTGHLTRLSKSAHHFGFDYRTNAVLTELTQLASQQTPGNYRVRLLLSSDGTLSSACFPLEAIPQSVSVQLAKQPIDSDQPFLRHKTTERSIYAAHAPAQGVFDTLLFNQRGEITEFTKGNVVVEISGKKLTPALNCGLLGGVFRADLIARQEIEEAIILLSEITENTRIWFINSVRGMVPAKFTKSIKST